MVCKLIPCVLASGLWFSDKLQRNEQLLETCLCCVSLFVIAPARLDHIAPWLQWISLSKKNFENQKKSGENRDCNLLSPTIPHCTSVAAIPSVSQVQETSVATNRVVKLPLLRHFQDRFLTTLVAHIARPASLVIWHRVNSHRRPNRNESPHRRHFASLDVNIHAEKPHRRPTSQDFRRNFCGIFLRHQSKLRGLCIASEKTFSHRQQFGGMQFESHRTSQLHRAIWATKLPTNRETWGRNRPLFCRALVWKRLKGKTPDRENKKIKLPKTSQKKAIFSEDFEDIQ